MIPAEPEHIRRRKNTEKPEIYEWEREDREMSRKEMSGDTDASTLSCFDL